MPLIITLNLLLWPGRGGVEQLAIIMRLSKEQFMKKTIMVNMYITLNWWKMFIWYCDWTYHISKKSLWKFYYLNDSQRNFLFIRLLCNNLFVYSDSAKYHFVLIIMTTKSIITTITYFLSFSLFCIITRNDGIIKMRNEHSQLATTYISCLLILMYTFTLVEYMMMMTEIMFKLRAILNDLHPKLHNLRISR